MRRDEPAVEFDRHWRSARLFPAIFPLSGGWLKAPAHYGLTDCSQYVTPRSRDATNRTEPSCEITTASPCG